MMDRFYRQVISCIRTQNIAHSAAPDRLFCRNVLRRIFATSGRFRQGNLPKEEIFLMNGVARQLREEAQRRRGSLFQTAGTSNRRRENGGCDGLPALSRS
jgi:hypothetical protein